MKFRLSLLAAAAILVTAGPALAQSQGTGSDGSNTSHAGGSSVSGGSSSSSSVSTSGGSNVGVVQGSVAEGSTTSSSNADGDQSGAATSGDSVNGQGAAVADAPNAAADGVVAQLPNLPAMDAANDATSASETRSSVVMWALAGAILAGLAVLYRRLPRPIAS